MFLAYWRRKTTANRRKACGRHAARPLQAERLESRRLLSAVVMSDWEQMLIELVNRARADPPAAAVRYGVTLNEGLSPGTISAAPKQPLAPNQILRDAAGDHSQDMLDRDFFSHINPDGESPFDRMKNAGYAYTTAGENLSWTGTTGKLDRDGAIFSHHEGLFESPGHRVNILGPSFREIGAGVRHGVFTSGNDFNASMVTEKFGARSGNPFVTGVVYEDVIVEDDFYTIGEGLQNVTVTAVDTSSGTEFVTQSGPSGGYSLRVPTGTYTVTALGGELDQPITTRDVVVGAENRKVDFDASEPPEMVVWQNPLEPLDVNGNGSIEPLDALIIINYLNRSSAGPPPVMTDAPPPYLDLRGTGSVAPLDALIIINYLNRQNGIAGEGEFGAGNSGADNAQFVGSNHEQHSAFIEQGLEKTLPEPDRLRRQSVFGGRADSRVSARFVLKTAVAKMTADDVHGHGQSSRASDERLLHLSELEGTISGIAEDILRVWES